MNQFINVRDGLISITTYRPSDCQATTLTDFIDEVLAGTDEYLTASFDADELCKHPRAYVFLNECGVCSRPSNEGTTMFYELDDERFTVLCDNAVTTGWE